MLTSETWGGFTSVWPWLLIGIFFVVQVASLNYGHRINDLPWVRTVLAPTEQTSFGSQFSDQTSVIGSGVAGKVEGIPAWLLRFKLYSVDPDEVLNLLALARIQPDRYLFDPYLYQYGGSYLYPLGLTYYLGQRLGVIEQASLTTLLTAPAAVDALYATGRLFVLSAFTASAGFFYVTARRLLPDATAVLALLVYLVVPASIMLSQTMKPHWYALLPITVSLWLLVRLWHEHSATVAQAALVGSMLGLTIGSVSFAAPFVLIFFGALWLAYRKSYLSARLLVLAGMTTMIVFVLTNPYLFLNRQAAQVELALNRSWFSLSFDPVSLWLTFTNSLLAGFGVLTLLTLASGVLELRQRTALYTRPLFLCILAIMLWLGLINIPTEHSHIGFRFVPYLLPLMILFSFYVWRHQTQVLVVVALVTVLQATPLVVAYFDEDRPEYSTRLRAAAWIDTHVPAGAAVCTGTQQLAPFNSPPFRFDRFAVNGSPCQYQVAVEREMDAVTVPAGFAVVQRFRPRFTGTVFPLVYSHINPQISIYSPTL